MSSNFHSNFVAQFATEQILTNEQTVALHNLMKNGEQNAREQLVKANMRLVIKVARDYRFYGMDFEDVVSNGTMGLLKAIEVFDSTKGDFSSCASAWINKYVRMGFEQARAIKTKRYERMNEEERQQSVVESLNEKIGDGETEFAESLASDDATPAESAEHDSTMEAMLEAIDKALDAREQFIVRNRYGVDGNETMTLQEIADRLNCTHERVRQLEVQALAKMRDYMER